MKNVQARSEWNGENKANRNVKLRRFMSYLSACLNSVCSIFFPSVPFAVIVVQYSTLSECKEREDTQQL